MMAEVDSDDNGKMELEEYIMLMFRNDLSTSDDNTEDMKIAFRYLFLHVKYSIPLFVLQKYIIGPNACVHCHRT